MEKLRVYLGATVAMLVAFLMVAMNCVAPVVEAGGSSADASDRSGFSNHSGTGCTDDGTYYNSASYGIKLEDGGWGDFEVSEFPTCTISFYFMALSSVYESCIVTIEDDNDNANYVEIEVRTDGADDTKMYITDHYKGQSIKDSKEVAVDTTGSSDWKQVNIKMYKTSSGTDGTKKMISVEVGSVSGIELEMLSPELSTDVKERSFHRVTATAGVDDIVYTDDWDVDVDSSSFYGLNWTWIAIGLTATGMVACVVLDLPPLNKKGYIRKKIGK